MPRDSVLGVPRDRGYYMPVAERMTGTLPMRRLEREVPVAGAWGDTATWQGKGAAIVEYERNAAIQGLGKLNYFSASDFAVYESAVVEGSVKFALKHYLYGASMISRSPERQSTSFFMSVPEFAERARAAIGLCRFLYANWSGFGYKLVDGSGNAIPNWWDDRLAWISYTTQWWPPSL